MVCEVDGGIKIVLFWLLGIGFTTVVVEEVVVCVTGPDTIRKLT